MPRLMTENFTPMGRVIVEAKIENFTDLEFANRGVMAEDEVRSVVVPDALIDTGATMVSLPASMIETLGLRKVRTRRIQTAGGPIDADHYSAVKLTVQGRDCVIDVMELPEGVPALIGQVPLELLDFVVNPADRTLIGNPRHGGEWMYDAYTGETTAGPADPAPQS